MLIDAFSENWIEELNYRASVLGPACRLYLLVDGAFVSCLHRSIAIDRKALLFASLPGCNEAANDASPFLTPYDPGNQQLRVLLQRCDRWPMLSAVETPESLDRLAARLASWCVVEADGQRFNFRFPDTRRLPAIYRTLTPQQRAALVGPVTRWCHIGRDGKWCELPLNGKESKSAAEPILDERQFAALVDDSRLDELLVALRDRGHDVFECPSRSHGSLATALCVALAAELDEHDVLQWCEWFWKHGKPLDETAAASLLRGWQKES